MPEAADTSLIQEVLARASDGFASLSDVPVWSLNGSQCRTSLVAMAELTARMTELTSRLLMHADEVDAFPGLSVKDGYAVATRLTRPEAGRQVRLAGLLAAHDLTRADIGSGGVNAEQARVICEAVDALPDEAVGIAEEAELFLLAEAKHHDAKALKILGQHVLEVVDPAAGEAHAAKLLEAEEAAAQKATRFTLVDDGHGQTHGRFTLPTAQGDMLRKALSSLAAPKHHRAVNGAGSYEHERPTPEKLGQAFAEYVETYPRDDLPHAGGVNATVVVTVPYESLLGGLGPGVLDTGTEISPAQARRLACEARVIPAVLGGKSQVLDLGRSARLHSEAQRLALTITQRHCQHPGCDVPASGCHVHHPDPWSHGGKTDLDNAKLLCPRHHHLAHANLIQRT